MPRREDEYWLAQHPPACTCVACNEKRLRRLGLRRGPPGRLEALAQPLPWLLRAIALYAALSFAFSLLGLLGPPVQASRAIPSVSALALEVAAHFVFGFIIGAATRQWRYALLAGPAAVALDVDHLPGFMGAEVMRRPSHTLPFLAASALLIGAVSAKDSRQRILTGAVIAGAVASHLAFDALSGNAVFPLLAPFSFAPVSVPVWAGAALEAVAFLGVLAVAQGVRRR